MFNRLELLIGKESLEKLHNTKVLIVGVGGVGGTCLEALVRSGIGHITVVDGDVFNESNLNRQIICTISNLGSKKVDEAIKRAKTINNDIDIIGYDIYLNKDNINVLENYDFIIDACDDVPAKLLLMKYAEDNNITLISSMGTGKRLNPSEVIVTRLDKTFGDPLAKKLRNEARKLGLSLKVTVVCSKEETLNNDRVVASSIFVPSTAGLNIAYVVLKKVIG